MRAEYTRIGGRWAQQERADDAELVNVAAPPDDPVEPAVAPLVTFLHHGELLMLNEIYPELPRHA